MTDAKDDKLTQLIADAIEQAEAEEKERKALAEDQKIEFDSLMKWRTEQALSKIKDFPAALLPYCQAGQGPGCWNHEDSIEQLEKGWLPERFTIDAPGLVRISFATCKVNGAYVVTGIAWGGCSGTTTDWSKAIAGAAKQFQEIASEVRDAK